MTDQELIDAFLKDYYVILPVEHAGALERIRNNVAAGAFAHLNRECRHFGHPPQAFLDHISEEVNAETLNALRLAAFSWINSEPGFREDYLSLARHAVEVLVGNEIVMQRRVNLSIQLPGDSSSLLHIHSDVWDGDSPYELVIWLPLVDCFKTKSMYIVPLEVDRSVQAQLSNWTTTEDIYHAVKDRARFLDIPYGHILLFSPTVMHGNRVNEESTTRWSMNCRVKSYMSPYADKRLGEFFEPVTIRPVTRIGAAYKLPGGFE